MSRCVIRVNSQIDGAYIFSSGKDMGVFKAVGYPEDVGEFYRLEEYEGYCWTAHGRYPTNTPGWWGGAHPFALLDYSVVHNGEISSYDANRRAIEMYGYECTLLTDTEVITYIIDYPGPAAGTVPAKRPPASSQLPSGAPLTAWTSKERARLTYLRNAFASLLITGPFSILVGFSGGHHGPQRPAEAAQHGSGRAGTTMVYIASEESAIRVIEPELDSLWSPRRRRACDRSG